ncbi:MAG: aminotransferase class I/II-fold pyridoxal phosphate-dependent enzyme [Saprospiraceae bacterium]
MSTIIDYCSSSYLGIQHSSWELAPWAQLNTGKPAAFQEQEKASLVAKKVARLQGLATGLLFSSTFHLFWDVFQGFSALSTAIFVDDKTYPIARWATEMARLKGVVVEIFRQGDINHLKALLATKHRCPIVLTDGWNLQEGRLAPIRAYAALVKAHRGLLVIDDTQSIGLLGKKDFLHTTYGKGGGGVLPHLGIQDTHVLVGSSLAKAFGVPIAVLSGSQYWIEKIKKSSLTRIHCSPPSSALISAANHALLVNVREGELRRHQLRQNVLYFQQKLQRVGLQTPNHLFPIQCLEELPHQAAIGIHRRLKERGIQTLLLARPKGPCLSFLIRSDHTKADIDLTTEWIGRYSNPLLTFSKKHFHGKRDRTQPR